MMLSFPKKDLVHFAFVTPTMLHHFYNELISMHNTIIAQET